MFQGVLRATRVLLDGRNRFPVNLKYTQTRKRNDRRRIKILKENALIIREGREALRRRMEKEAEILKAGSPSEGMSPAP